MRFSHLRTLFEWVQTKLKLRVFLWESDGLLVSSSLYFVNSLAISVYYLKSKIQTKN